MISTWRAAEVVVGIALVYFRFCLYESEEGRLQNALVELWLRICDRADTAKQRFLQLLTETAQISVKLFDRLFGRELISFRAFAVSSTLAYASIALTNAWEAASEAARLEHLALGVAFVIIATLPLLTQAVWAARIRGFIATAAVALICAALLFAVVRNQSDEMELAISVSSILICPIVDFAWLLVCRRALERALQQHRISEHVRGVLAGVAVVYWSTLMPLVATYASFSLAIHSGNPAATKAMVLLGLLFFSITFTRVFVSVVSIVQLVLLIVAFLHWIIWPSLSRIVYSAERFKLFKERRLFGSCGAALLFDAAGGVTWIQSGLKALSLLPW
jgi:hypothetical protein